MVIYIAGPMTGVEDLNRPAFMAREKELKAQGHIVLNPHSLPVGMEYEQYMKICLSMVDVCEVIALLPGYQNSPGARREVARAKGLGKRFLIGIRSEP